MSVNDHLKFISDNLTKFINDALAKLSDDEPGCKISLKSGNGKKSESQLKFLESPKFFLEILNENNKLILMRQDHLIDELKEEYEGKLNEKDRIIDNLRSEHRQKANELDALAQYNRRDNLKIEGIEGIPETDGENINNIVKDLARVVGVEIHDSDISHSHRLGTNSNNSSNSGSSNAPVGTATPARNKPRSIIVRFTRRDAKIKLFEARKAIKTHSSCPTNYRNAEIYEDVTPLRSRIMYELRIRNNREAFKYVWSKGGRIYCLRADQVVPRGHLRQEEHKSTVINTPEDLKKVGFTQEEIDDIIQLKRK